MKDKKWILGLVILVIAIGALSIWGFKKSENEATNSQVSGDSTSAMVYYSEDAKVMEFYSDYCSWCIKQNEILARLGAEGYKVKPMDVGKNPSFWTDYKINGTPTFVASNGDKLEGYQDYDQLKAFLDKHK
jgi:protein-disulfide isomerase